MCESLVDIQCATAEIRRGKKEERKKEERKKEELECGPMPNVMAALPNRGGALCSTPQSLADAHYWSAVQYRCPDAKPGCPKLPERSQPLVDRSSPYCAGHLEEILLLNEFFPIVDMCLNCEDIARQSWAMVPRWQFFGIFWVLHFQRAACSTFRTCILNSH